MASTKTKQQCTVSSRRRERPAILIIVIAITLTTKAATSHSNATSGARRNFKPSEQSILYSASWTWKASFWISCGNSNSSVAIVTIISTNIEQRFYCKRAPSSRSSDQPFGGDYEVEGLVVPDRVGGWETEVKIRRSNQYFMVAQKCFLSSYLSHPPRSTNTFVIRRHTSQPTSSKHRLSLIVIDSVCLPKTYIYAQVRRTQR